MSEAFPCVRARARPRPWFALLVAAMVLAGCKEQTARPTAGPAAAAEPAAVPEATPQQPDLTAPATLGAASAPAAAAVLAPRAPASASGRRSLSVQGVAAAGVTVRVKAIELGGDATVLDVSISFANHITNSAMLALADTFVEDDSGARLHIKRPEGNRDLVIREGQTLDGQLVFLGSVPTTARHLRLVFNEGNDGDNIVAPGLVMELPLQGT